MASYLYIFLDEGGNFDFSHKGTRFFTLTCVSKTRPFQVCPGLDDLKYNLIESGIDVEFFHCSQDSWHIREKVFSIIESNINNIQIDTLIVEKRKTGPALRDIKRFYPEMLGYLLRYILKGAPLSTINEVIIITDSIPVNQRKRAIEKAIKTTLKTMLPQGVKYRIMHHASKSSFGLQIADYCNWAIFRKWEGEDPAAYSKILKRLNSEFDIFQLGRRFYY